MVLSFFFFFLSFIPVFFFFLFFFFLICSEFCHTLKWNVLECTCLPHPDPPSHLPLHPLPPGLPRAPGPSACLMHPTWADEMCRFTSCHLVRGLCCRHAPLRPLLGLAFPLSHLLGSCSDSFINSLENKNHGIWSHHFMAGRPGNNGNSETLYFFRLQNHCRWWLQPWN